MSLDIQLPSAGLPGLEPPALIRLRISLPDSSVSIAANSKAPGTSDPAAAHGEAGVPWVMLVHGYLASMDWGFLPWIERELVSRGLGVVAVTLSGAGFEEDPTRVTHLKAFARDTYARELADLAAVRDWLESERPAGLNPELAGIWGHSRGSAMALVHASEVGGYSALCTWATVGSVGRYDPHRLVEWQANGFLTVETARGQKLRLERDLYRDFTENAERYNLARLAREWVAPTLLVHGERDRSVPLEEAAQHAREFGSPSAVLHSVGGTGHNFSTRHPCEAPGPALRAALEATGRFFESVLLPQL